MQKYALLSLHSYLNDILCHLQAVMMMHIYGAVVRMFSLLLEVIQVVSVQGHRAACLVRSIEYFCDIERQRILLVSSEYTLPNKAANISCVLYEKVFSEQSISHLQYFHAM